MSPSLHRMYGLGHDLIVSVFAAAALCVSPEPVRAQNSPEASTQALAVSAQNPVAAMYSQPFQNNTFLSASRSTSTAIIELCDGGARNSGTGFRDSQAPDLARAGRRLRYSLTHLLTAAPVVAVGQEGPTARHSGSIAPCPHLSEPLSLQPLFQQATGVGSHHYVTATPART